MRNSHTALNSVVHNKCCQESHPIVNWACKSETESIRILLLHSNWETGNKDVSTFKDKITLNRTLKEIK